MSADRAFDCLGRSKAVRPAGHGKHRFKTVGLYALTLPLGSKCFHDYYDFFKACGYNHLEFVDLGFCQRPNLFPKYYAGITATMESAQRKGFEVWFLILACMQQWKGPAKVKYAGTFSAVNNKKLVQERLANIKKAVWNLRNADGFVFFAGDPGGDPQGRSTVYDMMDLSRKVRMIVEQNAPEAQFNVNLWAVAEWSGFPSPFGLTFWRKQVVLSKAVAEAKSFFDRSCGVVFSLDNYYRSLALACYSDAKLKPELYPLASDVKRLHKRGVSVCGWPYFLVDECDDGFIKPNNVASGGQAQAETRYIRAIIDHGRKIGLDGMVANASSIGVTAEPLNIYAFGQMCQRPDLTPESLLDEYAGIIADDKTRSSLAQILRFIENHSNWQNSLPLEYRLKNLSCGDLKSASAAIERIRRIVPRRPSPIPLPEPPVLYLKRLEKRLCAIADGKIGGTNNIIRTQKKGS